jgi:hypothetical protein
MRGPPTSTWITGDGLSTTTTGDGLSTTTTGDGLSMTTTGDAAYRTMGLALTPANTRPPVRIPTIRE